GFVREAVGGRHAREDKGIRAPWAGETRPTPRARGPWALRPGAAAMLVPILVVAGGAVAYAGTLHLWKDGDTLFAADLNGNFSNLDMRVTTLENAPALAAGPQGPAGPQGATGPAAFAPQAVLLRLQRRRS